ncbi:hypothetical protein [Pseudonocardia spirodelae]|uniref:Uncharacterized protein n=1 Tax=Pseudonocardia spirodelae TaxID=3133431 RepID=A0ABU8T6V7_9PSEU
MTIVPQPGTPCSTGAESIDCAVDDAIAAVAAGDGARAASIVRGAGMSEQSDRLADVIFRAGVVAVDEGRGDTYAPAVATMFTDGGAPLAVATDSFRIAGTLAATNGLTPDQARAGSAAIAQTYAAYAV